MSSQNTLPPRKYRDISAVSNSELRPWTVNEASEARLSQEMEALEQTIKYISPQMKAGKRGNSVLDGRIPVVLQFETTVLPRVQQSPYRTRFEPRKGAYPPHGHPSNHNSSHNSYQSSKLPSRQNFETTIGGFDTIGTSNNFTLRSDDNQIRLSDRKLDEDPFPSEYIASLQREIFYNSRTERMRRTKPPGSAPAAVRFQKNKIPAVLSVGYSQYLKLKKEVEDKHSFR